jgi:hypothetical protein
MVKVTSTNKEIHCSCSDKFLSALVCCAVLLPFLTWLAAATNATIISAAIKVGLNINSILFCECRCGYCSYCRAATSTAGTVIATAIAIVWRFIVNSYCCHHCICQHHCYHYPVVAIVGPPLSLLTAVAFVQQIIAVKLNVSHQC